MICENIHTPERNVAIEDIEHFAEFSGDNFYANVDDKAAAANPLFLGRVALGYLRSYFTARLLVEPNTGLVLANTGLDNQAFEGKFSSIPDWL